jgi:hypothetical protein
MEKICIKCRKKEAVDEEIKLCQYCLMEIRIKKIGLKEMCGAHPMSNERAIHIIENFLGIAPDENLDNLEDMELDTLLDIALCTAIKSLKKEIKS